MNNIKGVILDYGGTLDTNGVHWFHIFRNVYAEHLPQVSEEKLREAYVYGERYLATHRVIEPADDFLAMLEKKVAIQLLALGIEDEVLKCKIAAECDTLVRINMETTREVLDALAGRYPMVLVSNFYGNIHAVLCSYGLDGYFKEIVESAVVGIRKPNPQIFALGVEALGMQPGEVVVVGDSYGKDMAPAHSIGCHTVWIKGQGWDATDEPADTLCAGHIITELTQVLEVLV
ncbi:MAG: HAD family hydrolase [Bacteroidaceae bacterium]|nr:HAD family hydrolase [Bacteroidaceae bacterium]